MRRGLTLRKLVRLGREETGAELVEFALSSLMLVVLMFAVFNWTLGMYVYHFMSYAAQQGTRFAMVRGHTWSKNATENCGTSAPPNFTMAYNCTAQASDIQNYIQSLAHPWILPSGMTINTSSSYVWPGKNPDGNSTGCSTNANSPGCLVKVTVSYNFAFLPLMKLTGLPLSATSEKVITQ
jgi:Flp pilus assembly protein TadG